MKQTIIFSCITFLLGIFCAHGFHALIDQNPDNYYPSNQQGSANTTSEPKTLYKELTINQSSSSTHKTINPTPQKLTTKNAIAAATPKLQQPTTKIDEYAYEHIKGIWGLLPSSKK